MGLRVELHFCFTLVTYLQHSPKNRGGVFLRVRDLYLPRDKADLLACVRISGKREGRPDEIKFSQRASLTQALLVSIE